jgi:hypothetical protein
VPESFKVLGKELPGLGLDVRLERKEQVVTSEELFEKLVRRELAHVPALEEAVAAAPAPNASKKSQKNKK